MGTEKIGMREQAARSDPFKKGGEDQKRRQNQSEGGEGVTTALFRKCRGEFSHWACFKGGKPSKH